MVIGCGGRDIVTIGMENGTTHLDSRAVTDILQCYYWSRCIARRGEYSSLVAVEGCNSSIIGIGSDFHRTTEEDSQPFNTLVVDTVIDAAAGEGSIVKRQRLVAGIVGHCAGDA